MDHFQGNNDSNQDHHHHLNNQHKDHQQPDSKMNTWRRDIYSEYSMSLFLTEDEELAMDGLLLLHKQPTLKFLEKRQDAQNKTIFSRNVTIVDNPIIENRKEAILESTHKYECKTCNKRFSSFQALGGHRTSHKKPKTTTISIPNPYVHNTFNRNRFIDNGGCNLDISLGSSFSAIGSSSMPSSASNCNIAIKKKKIHECSICGAKFFSGQALGGHMRRHRRVVTPLIRNSPTRPSNSFSLDLNLPALYESDLAEHRNSSQQLPASTSTSPPNFSLDNVAEYHKDITDPSTSFQIDCHPLMTINPEQNTKP